MNNIIFIDTEIEPTSKKVLDLGAVNRNWNKFHSPIQKDFSKFISNYEFICGHNIIEHDLKYINNLISNKNNVSFIDTLYLSPLLFPNNPYHKLLKDDKLIADELNNPLNDAIKCMELLFDEVNTFNELSDRLKNIYYNLLINDTHFMGFFKYLGYKNNIDLESNIKSEFCGKICENANLEKIIKENSVELAYCLALISTNDKYSIIPPWIIKNYPQVDNIMKRLRNTPCSDGCKYCNNVLNAHIWLKKIFGYNDFRKYNGEPLQERAVNSAIENKSLLAIFPTGGGKSITFQLPALISGETSRGLTVIISPLQSLMKDQVDNLIEKGIPNAVTINGLLSPIEKSDAIQQVQSGLSNLLYISPESLRSKTIEKLLLSRNVVRFVIDEAHCFSSYGHDFRPDYLYIGEFIKELQNKKGLDYNIPVSCFTATAKQKVIHDIMNYFKEKLNLELELYVANSSRDNLQYEVLSKETDEDKYITLRELITQEDCPTIVYVARTKRTTEIAERLSSDGFSALAFNGQMDSKEKINNQEDFINGKVQIMVATSAFGMGVDKKDVKLVIHYEISNSLEDYVQEAGRAGRDQSLNAKCYILYNENDLDKHFLLLNQSRINISEIQQVWKAIKDLTKNRDTVFRSPLEIARQAGWDDNVKDIETRVKTAISSLENSGYVKRGQNAPRVYANSILVKSMIEASNIINSSNRFDEKQKLNASRIINLLISSRSNSKANNDDAESRIDYLSDLLGIPKNEVIQCINLMREEKLLSDTKDLTAYIYTDDTKNKSAKNLNKFAELEKFLLCNLKDEHKFNLKELNELTEKSGLKNVHIKDIKTIFYYWSIKHYIKVSYPVNNIVNIDFKMDINKINDILTKRIDLSHFIVEYLYNKSIGLKSNSKEEILVLFSVLELKEEYLERKVTQNIDLDDIENSLLYLAKINSLNLEGGFLVLYNAIQVKRLISNNFIKYKKEDYQSLKEHYLQKIQQIHIVGEYAKLMIENPLKAQAFVNEYFQMEYNQFLSKYFNKSRIEEITRNITPKKYNQLFGSLSNSQRSIIDDKTSQYIVVTAGPGSGKTRILVHKLASIMLMEDVKHEQLLMLTFSRVATTEFKNRLYQLIGNSAHFIDIKTFHSYCFDLLGKVGNLKETENIVIKATNMIKSNEVEISKITKTVIVIDEAQDMDSNEYALIQALIEKNEKIRVIAVGDDDQNIYEFRGSNSKHLKSLITENGAIQYNLLENYRSKKNIVELANAFSSKITDRLKINPIVAIQQDNGIVKLIKHSSRNLEVPIVEQIKNNSRNGTIAVLTNSNDEAIKVMGLLLKNGIQAKLKTGDDFNIYNLTELRYFLKLIKKDTTSPLIDDKTWDNAIEILKITYQNSECLNLCLNLLDTFNETYPYKYKTDLEMFIKESNLEDFCTNNQGKILVSTIHKSKGCEFDTVYMLLENVPCISNEDKRKIYVGLTRAKNELYIHYNNSIFDGFNIDGVENLFDSNIYNEPNEIMIQLYHKDIFLDFFKGKKSFILKHFISGSELTIKGYSLYFKSQEILRFSQRFKERLIQLQSKGYYPYKSTIRFIVAWQGKEDNLENAIILPNLYLKK